MRSVDFWRIWSWFPWKQQWPTVDFLLLIVAPKWSGLDATDTFHSKKWFETFRKSLPKQRSDKTELFRYWRLRELVPISLTSSRSHLLQVIQLKFEAWKFAKAKCSEKYGLQLGPHDHINCIFPACAKSRHQKPHSIRRLEKMGSKSLQIFDMKVLSSFQGFNFNGGFNEIPSFDHNLFDKKMFDFSIPFPRNFPKTWAHGSSSFRSTAKTWIGPVEKNGSQIIAKVKNPWNDLKLKSRVIFRKSKVKRNHSKKKLS